MGETAQSKRRERLLFGFILSVIGGYPRVWSTLKWFDLILILILNSNLRICVLKTSHQRNGLKQTGDQGKQKFISVQFTVWLAPGLAKRKERNGWIWLMFCKLNWQIFLDIWDIQDKEKRNLRDESIVFALDAYRHKGVITRRIRLEEEQIWGRQTKKYIMDLWSLIGLFNIQIKMSTRQIQTHVWNSREWHEQRYKYERLVQAVTHRESCRNLYVCRKY